MRVHGRALVMALVLAAGPAFAEDALKDYWAAKNKAADQAWLVASESGMSWANADLANRPAKPIYCSPGQFALTKREIVAIFEAYAKAHPDLGDYPLGLVLKDALQDKFPC